MAAEQTYKSHRKYIPVFHFFVEPVLLLNVIAQALYFNKYQTLYKAWMVVVAVALAIVPFAARYMMARVQDRVIRLEERLRLASLLPAELRERINELTMPQLVALRFASDGELTGLAQRCLSGELTKADQIKREINIWRPDYARG
jgi:hypothetical protein